MRWMLAGATAVSLAALFFVVALPRLRGRPAAPTLAYTIQGGTVVDGGYLRELGRDGIKLVFNEGTQFQLATGARSHLRSIDANGAHIAIEHGDADFRITPRVGGRWFVDVGPFLVTVKGTIFSVSWDAAAGRFELGLRRGQVSVSGPVSGGNITLRAGQRLLVNLAKAETLITEQAPGAAPSDEAPTHAAETVAAAPSEQPTTASERPSIRGGLTSAGRDKPDSEHRWAAAVATGNWDRILADAERAGVKAMFAKASSDDLFALADAARYRRRPELARSALLAERRRFPDSPRRHDVAFLMGRVEESTDRGAARALRWYDEYLSQAGTGTYASEALGRKMILTSKLKGSKQARPVAEDYLRRFPTGTYAGTARALRGL
jgi:hypothetical protein